MILSVAVWGFRDYWGISNAHAPIAHRSTNGSQPHPHGLYSGSSLATHLFDAVGLVVILGAVALIIFKFFLGQSKNIGAGVGALLAVGVLAYLAQNPQSVLDMGKTVLSWIGVADVREPG